MNDLRLPIGKMCSKCGTWKLLDEFTRRRAMRDGHKSACRTCSKNQRDKPHIKAAEEERRRRYKERNREELLRYGRARARLNRQRPEKKEYTRSFMREYRQNNKEALAAANRQWRDKHPEQVRMYTQRRKSRKLNQQGEPYTGDDIIQMHEDQDGRCYYCQAELADYHIEHCTPLSRGGLDCLHNIVLACRTCNLRKHTKTAEEFLEVIRGTAL